MLIDSNTNVLINNIYATAFIYALNALYTFLNQDHPFSHFLYTSSHFFYILYISFFIRRETMKKQKYVSPEIEMINLAEEVQTLTTTSNPDIDGTSVLVSWLIG